MHAVATHNLAYIHAVATYNRGISTQMELSSLGHTSKGRNFVGCVHIADK